jgi:hypothetical protein
MVEIAARATVPFRKTRFDDSFHGAEMEVNLRPPSEQAVGDGNELLTN